MIEHQVISQYNSTSNINPSLITDVRISYENSNIKQFAKST